MTKQSFEIGKTVKIGFMTLVVIGKEELHERADKWLPCAYILESSKGVRYSFTPHNGLAKL